MASTTSIAAGSHVTSKPPSSQNQNNDAVLSGDADQQRRNRQNRGKWRGRGRGGGRNNRRSNQDTELDASAADTARQKKAQPPRPTHFLALPLHNHAFLNTQMTAFHHALFHPSDLNEPLFATKAPLANSPSSTNKAQNRRPPPTISTLVEGLDTSIVIDPVRMHMTLGVMALELDEDAPTETEDGDRMFTGPDLVSKEDLATPSTALELGVSQGLLAREAVSSSTTVYKVTSANVDITTSQATSSTSTSTSNPKLTTAPKSRKTIASALSLLSSLKPTISEILNGTKGVKVPLEVMDVLKSQQMRLTKGKAKEGVVDAGGKGRDERVGAGVLFLGPAESKNATEDEERMKLKRVTDLVHKTFRQNGYITENRPLKLHCSILNASHRRPPRNRGQPFSYSDILALKPALRTLGAEPLSSSSPLSTPSTRPRNTDNATIIENSIPLSRVAGSDPEEVTPDDDGMDATQLPGSDALLDGSDERGSRPKKSRTPMRAVVVPPPPLPIHLGTYLVNTIELWKMGSFGPNGEYVSCGGIELE